MIQSVFTEIQAMRFLQYLLVLSATLLTPMAYAEEKASDVIQAENPFARASVPGMAMSAVFMTLKNTGEQEHFLVEAQSGASANTELHGHVLDKGMMRMRQMAHIHLKPGQDKILKPGGLHIMLIGLTTTLIEGHEIKLKLTFDDGSEQTLTVPVKSISAKY
jgi:copper(I)-binding protein